jgi:hypothetical protein
MHACLFQRPPHPSKPPTTCTCHDDARRVLEHHPGRGLDGWLGPGRQLGREGRRGRGRRGGAQLVAGGASGAVPQALPHPALGVGPAGAGRGGLHVRAAGWPWSRLISAPACCRGLPPEPARRAQPRLVRQGGRPPARLPEPHPGLALAKDRLAPELSGAVPVSPAAAVVGDWRGRARRARRRPRRARRRWGRRRLVRAERKAGECGRQWRGFGRRGPKDDGRRGHIRQRW